MCSVVVVLRGQRSGSYHLAPAADHHHHRATITDSSRGRDRKQLMQSIISIMPILGWDLVIYGAVLLFMHQFGVGNDGACGVRYSLLHISNCFRLIEVGEVSLHHSSALPLDHRQTICLPLLDVARETWRELQTTHFKLESLWYVIDSHFINCFSQL